MAQFFKSSLQKALKTVHYAMCIFVALLAVMAVGTMQMFVSKQTLNHFKKESSVLFRFLWDAAILLGFMLQHSLMATPWVKDKLRSWLGVTVSQRLLYTTVSSLALLICVLHWQAIPETGLWLVDTRDRWLLRLLFFLLHAVAWLLWGLQVMLMDPGEMIGLTQVHHYYTDKPAPPGTPRTHRKLLDFYSHLRHPGASLVTALLWVHPLMTLDRVLLACWLACYMVWRHSLSEMQYTFAEKHFTTVVTTRKSRASVNYEYTEEM